MHRALIKLNKQPILANKFYGLSIVRGFSTKDSGETEELDKTSKEKKSPTSKDKKSSTSKSVAVKSERNSNVGKTKDESLQSQSKVNKMEALLKKARNIDSIGPNDKETISRVTGKPKAFVRQSARNPAETANIINDDEPAQVLASGLDKRLVDAARRVASRMPKHIAKATEKELLDSIEKQKQDTLQAKKEYEADRRPREDFTKSISYQIMKESRQSNKQGSPFDETERVGSTVERIPSRRSFAKNVNQTSFDDDLTEMAGSTTEVIQSSKYSRSRYSTNQTDKSQFVSNARFMKNTSLFSGECLNIFDPKGLYLSEDLNANGFWKSLLREETELSFSFAPENPFEEMISMTKDGKLWHYPINNEQGLQDDTPFYEHVLLDSLLEGFPDKGPVRQFMELVILGLSHNPYITVERKHETVAYYKNFFEEKNLLDLVTLSESSSSATQ